VFILRHFLLSNNEFIASIKAQVNLRSIGE
jgi:hypothetical protein